MLRLPGLPQQELKVYSPTLRTANSALHEAHAVEPVPRPTTIPERNHRDLGLAFEQLHPLAGATALGHGIVRKTMSAGPSARGCTRLQQVFFLKVYAVVPAAAGETSAGRQSILVWRVSPTQS